MILNVIFPPLRTIRAHDSKLQTQIYNYLEKCLPYTKQQLTSEVNEYAIKKSESDVRTHERNLQKEINQIMPSIKEKYEYEVKRTEEQRAAYQALPGEKPEHQIRNPRRKFQWNDNLRYAFVVTTMMMICSIYRLIMCRCLCFQSQCA